MWWMKSSGLSLNTFENFLADLPLDQFWKLIYGNQEDCYMVLMSGIWDPTLDDLDSKTIKDHNCFSWPDQADQVVSWCKCEDAAGREVYHCAHLVVREKRRKANAAPISCLYADDVPADHPLLQDKPPSIIVETSPGKFQAYWRLTRELKPSEFERLNKRLAYALGVDVDRQRTWKLTQLLRTPGTHNRKRPPNQYRVTVSALADAVYSPEEFDQYLPPLSDHREARETQGRGHWVAEMLRAGIGEHSRNTKLTRCVGHFLAKGLSVDVSRELLSVMNETRCRDSEGHPAPLSEKELDKIFASVLRDWRRQRTETLPAAERTMFEFLASPGGRSCTLGERVTYQALLAMQWYRGLSPGTWMDVSGRDLENFGSVSRKSISSVLRRLQEKRYIDYQEGQPFRYDETGKPVGGKPSRVRLLPLPGAEVVHHNHDNNHEYYGEVLPAQSWVWGMLRTSRSVRSRPRLRTYYPYGFRDMTGGLAVILPQNFAKRFLTGSRRRRSPPPSGCIEW